MMKKIITLLFAFMFFIMPIKTYADSATVEVKVNGEVTKGSTIEILVDVKDVENLYAASVDFTYYMNQLKVESIKAGEFIANYSNDIMELGGETDKNGNTASYSFTFLGEKEGIKGNGTLAIITALILNDEELAIGKDNMKVKLVQRVEDTVDNYSYKFNGYNSTGIHNILDDNNDNDNIQSDLSNSESLTNKSEDVIINNNINNSNNGDNNSEDNVNEEILSTDIEQSNIQKEESEGSVVELSRDEENSINNFEEKKDVKDTTSKNVNISMIVIGIVVIMAIIGAFVYYLYLKKNKQ